MNKFLIPLLAFALQVSAASPTTEPVKPNALKLTQGTVTRVLPVNPPCLKCSYTEAMQSGQRKFAGGSLGGNWTQFPQNGGPISIEWVMPVVTCPPIPADIQQTVQCSQSNPGTTGTWIQTHGWSQTPPPLCTLTALPWLPTSAPAGACTQSGIPPQGNFHFVVTGNSVAFAGSTNSADPDGWLIAWSWNFGDGATSTSQNPTHVYATNGTYTVTETITDNDSLTSTTSQPVTIGAVTPVCPPMPPADTQEAQCPNGMGTFTQTHGWVASSPQLPPDGCWTALAWNPVTPPAGSCTQQPPPPGAFVIDLSYVNKTGAGYLRFKAYVDEAIRSNGSTYDLRPIDIMYMYKLDGASSYATKAIQLVDQQVTAAASAGANPAVAGDSYLGAGEMIGAVAITYAWANPMLTASQKTRWKAYADQCIFNIWNASQASWNGQPATWSSWSTDNPYNNYYYSFIQATMWWALASNSTAIVKAGKTALQYLQTDRIPLLSNAYALIPGGGSYEGTGYGVSHRTLFDQLYQIWLDSGQGDLRNAHETNSGEFWVYGTMPTMDRFVPLGDQSRVSEPYWYDYHRSLVLAVAHATQSTQVRADIGYLLANLKNGDGSAYDEMQNTYNFRYDMLPTPAGAAPVALTFRAPEVGLISARTAWNLDATALFVLMGRYSESHAHQEQGGFTYFGKRAWLAVPNNIWSHGGLHQDTGDKNIIRFERSGSPITQKFNDQVRVNVTNYTPNVTTGDLHLVGDISPIYADAGLHWVRTYDDISGVVTISDALTLAANVTAIWQLQTPVQPTVSGNVITAGHLKATVLLPASPQISVVSMPSLDSDYNSGWRVDIKGSTSAYKVELRTQ